MHSTIEEKLLVFQSLGFKVNEGIQPDELKTNIVAQHGKNPSFEDIYMFLGGCTETEAMIPYCNQCWYFDTECIDGKGSYIDILENLARLAQGNLNLHALKDVVNHDAERASVSFSLLGKTYEWELMYQDDWVDSSFFTKFTKLLPKLGIKGNFSYFDLGGQDLMIGWANDEAHLQQMIQATGLAIEWLAWE